MSTAAIQPTEAPGAHTDPANRFRVISRTPPGRVDREKGVISGVGILSAGIVKDRRFDIDDVFLDQVASAGAKAPKGLRSRFNHPDDSAGALGTYLGRIQNVRRDGSVVRGDLHLDPTSFDTPKGDLGGYVLDLAESDPDAFGMSIVFSGSTVPQLNEDGTPKTDAAGQRLPPFARLKRLFAADAVDEPNANDGLFSAFTRQTPAAMAGSMIRDALAGLDAHSQVQVADHYLSSRGLIGRSAPTPQLDESSAQNVEALFDLMDELIEQHGIRGTDAVRFCARFFEPAAARSAQFSMEAFSMDTENAQATQPSPTATSPAAPPDAASDAATENSGSFAPPDANAIRQAERERFKAISAAAAHLGLSEYGAELIDGDLSTEAACKALLDRHAQRNPPVSTIQVGESDRAKFVAQATDGLMLRAMAIDPNEMDAQRRADAETFRYQPFYNIAREALRREGVKPPDESKNTVIGLAMASTSDYPKLLENIAQKSVMKGFSQVPPTWNHWCDADSVTNFQDFSVVRISEADKLLLVREGGEYQDSTIDEAGEKGRCFTYGRIFSITRKAQINDDLRELSRIPQLMGRRAGELVDDLVYATLLGDNGFGPTMSDGNPFFLGSPNSPQNYLTDGDVAGANSTLDAVNGEKALEAAWLLMNNAKNLKGEENIMLSPKTLLIPSQLWVAATKLLRSTSSLEDNKNAGVINVWNGMAQIVMENRLSNTSFNPNASASAWYLIADQNAIDTFLVSFLEGRREPFLEQKEGFTVDGTQYKVRLDVGVTAIERRGVIKSKGAA